MTRHDPPYDPPAVEVIRTEDGPAVTAAGNTTYGAITLMEDDGKGRRKRLRGRIRRRKRSGE